MKKRILSLALVLVMIAVLLPAIPAAAEDYGPIEFETMYTGEITIENASDRYTVVLPEAGRLTTNIVTGTLYSGYVSWLNADGVNWTNQYGIIAGGSYSRSFDLQAGSYYIVVSKGVSSPGTGTYELTVTSETTVQFTIITASSPSDGGTITGGGSYQQNASVTLKATPNTGFAFDGWYEGNTRVSTNATYTFNATANRTLEARFTASSTWTINPSVMTFPAAMPGYGVQSPRAVAINNTGASALTGISAAITAGSGYFEFVATPVASVAAGAQTMASIRPKTGLAAGIYTGTLTISAGTGDSATSQTVSLSFAVGAAMIRNPHSSWAAEELERAFDLGLVPDSLTDASIDLRQPITRVEFAGIAVKTYELLANTTALPVLNNPFTDTQSVDALKAYNAGIMVGVSATEFAPDTILNRETAATALTRVFKRSTIAGWTYATDADFPLDFTRPAPFADDASISGWARDSVYFMFANDIIRGMGNNTFAPRATTTAQQAEGYANATREAALLIALRMIENLG